MVDVVWVGWCIRAGGVVVVWRVDSADLKMGWRLLQ